MMDNALKSLMDISRYVGEKIPMWNQGFGGNISIKESEFLYIKSTGKQLQNLTSKQDFSSVKWRELKRIPQSLTEDDYKDLIFKCSIQGEGWGRPSMETGLHSNSEKKWVIHFHSVAMVLVYEKFQAGQASKVKEIFNRYQLNIDFVAKDLPGLSLTKRIAEIAPSVEVIILQCHGVVLRSDNSEIIKKFENAEREIIDYFQWDMKITDSPTSPLKAYFPDTAVYWSQILTHLKKDANELYILTDDAPFYLREIWMAQSLIYKNNKESTSFSDLEISIITSLPTEQLRKK